MIRQDYILRMIAQFGQLWARLVEQLRAGLFHDAQATLDLAYEQMLGLPAEHARTLTAQDLLARMQFAAPPDEGRQRCLMLSALLAAEADIAGAQHLPDMAAQANQKALEILLVVLLRQPGLALPAYAPTVAQLTAALADYRLPPSTNRLLLEHYEQGGAFAKAEDCLFELRAQAGASAPLAALGEAFYQRLRGYTDEQLHAGNFSRHEIEAGLAAWHSRSPASDRPA